MSDLIDREALLRQIDIDSEGEPGYYGDTWKFIDTIKSMPPAELGTNLAEVGTDCISRQALLDKFEPWLKVKDYNDGELNMLKAILYEIRFMPSAQPYTINPDGRLWITVDDIDKVKAVVVDEHKSKFCKQFYEDYEDAQPDIIRCKDCKYWVPGYITDNDDFIPPKCGEWQQMVGHSSDDYCSLAERREVTT